MYDQIAISLIVMLGLDATYISQIKTPYLKQIENIQKSKVNVKTTGVVLCYLFMVFGINYFIIQKKASLLDAFLFGVVVYGVYDTTAYALFTNWSAILAILDVIWGGVLMLTTTYITYQFSA